MGTFCLGLDSVPGEPLKGFPEGVLSEDTCHGDRKMGEGREMRQP